ncbi:MAG: cytochrome c [Alphaproteobacteria bacterium]|nr:cytochrome c [Alphaproteobacteria bacterium]
MRHVLLAAALLAAASVPALADGAAVFDANCAFCHQAGGVGVPGQFPRLAGRAGAMAAKPAGKAFLPKVVLNGISGRIMVDGEQILGIMPALDTLSDEDIAAVLTYITGLDHQPVKYTAAEIKAARAQPKVAPTDMAAQHAALAAKKIVP